MNPIQKIIVVEIIETYYTFHFAFTFDSFLSSTHFFIQERFISIHSFDDNKFY